MDNKEMGTENKAKESCGKSSGKKCSTKKDELLLEIEKLRAELAEKDDKYLRMAAEYENFRRRSREEREATYEAAMADTVGELLPIIDNLERAANYDDGEKVKEGLTMTLKTVASVLSSMGIESVGKVGETFDPNLHNAVMHNEDEALGENVISMVFQKGFKIGDKVVRFAMVQVAN